MKKIKLFPAPHVELRVSVSDEMVEDYRECKRMEESGGELKDCDGCSWREADFLNTCMCDLDIMKQLLEEE